MTSRNLLFPLGMMAEQCGRGRAKGEEEEEREKGNKAAYTLAGSVTATTIITVTNQFCKCMFCE